MDTGDETFSVTGRAHQGCLENGNCGTIDCPGQQAPRRGFIRVAWEALQKALAAVTKPEVF